MVNIVDDTEQIQVNVVQPGEYENFLTYEKVDPNSDFTVTTTGINISSMRRDPPAYMRKTGIIVLGDFNLKLKVTMNQIDVNPTPNNSGGHAVIAAFTRKLTSTYFQTMRYIAGTGGNDGLAMYIYLYSTSVPGRYQYAMYLRDNQRPWTGSISPPTAGWIWYDTDNYGGVLPTFPITWYIHIVRTGTNTDPALHLQHVYAYVYSNPDYTGLLHTHHLYGREDSPWVETTPFTYFIPVCAYGPGGGGTGEWTFSGILENYLLTM